ncbi:muscle M-line assembly protein unc-89-like isoform X1 [Camellia sinensis]|uniref:muscle M-line assembly protein unc-89-like isoform X1 n=1 Tax=Camellia sinensis TaxID=4442 RepID=UPI001036C28F|nr:muscle M-line assembly protein unc-89-like isoform X1 [Camellia sinensis]XP_028068351.1 muscle M-line assembly protein unc-89-like isoform X1 [Camellia sinensis]
MGESIVEAPDVENKMRESLDSGASLEVSVSFGRFENDLLSWDKWSSFSQNKYLEEVEKCSTPGSVAQKKAYFEAHYKKIAARKAEQLDQEKQMETNHFTEDDQNGKDHVGQSYVEGVEQVTNSIGVMSVSHSDESNDNEAITEFQSSPVDGAKEEMNGILDSPKLNRSEEAVVVREDIHLNGFEEKVEVPPFSVQEDAHLNGFEDKVGVPSFSVQEDAHLNEFEDKVEVTPFSVQEDAHLNEFEDKVEVPPFSVQEDTHRNGSQDKVESPMNLEETGNTLENRKENAKLDASNKFRKVKVTPSKKDKSLTGTKKKPASSPLPKKSPEISTPKPSKPTSTSTWSSTKKTNGSSLPRSKNLSSGESKKVSPSSLHMSLSLGPSNSDSNSLTTTRKSLFMEKMGDKDIVKRAFKTFQNNFNQVRASDDGRSFGQKEMSTTRPEQKLFTSLTARKENRGIRKAAEKMDAQRAQLGRSWNATSIGSLKGSGMDQRSAKPAPSTFGLRSDERNENRKGPGMDRKSAKPAPSSIGSRSDERAEKRKEFFKKLQEKSYAKEAEKTDLCSKSKEEKEVADIKKLRQRLNFRATPMPGFYRGHATSKSPLDKEGAKNERHHRPERHR